MTDVIRGADIGIGLDIPDLGKIKQLNKAIDGLTKQGDDIGHLSSQFKRMFSAFDQGTVSRVNSVSGSLREVNQVIKDINRSTTSVRHTSDETSRTTTRHQHEYQDSLSKSRQYVKSLMDANEAYVRRLRMEGDQTKATEAKVDGLKNSHEALTNLLKKERSYLNQVKTASGEDSTAYNRQSAQVDKLRSQIVRNNSALTEAKSKMKATSAETVTFNRHGEKLRGTFSGLRSVFTAAIPSVLGLGAAFSKAAGEATKLQDQYTTVKGLLSTSGESNRQAAASTHEIQTGNRKLSKRYGIDQSNLAAGSEQLIRRGYSSKQEAGSHKSFVQASIATKDPYSSVVNYGSSALEQFGYRQKAGNSVSKMKKYTNQVLNQISYVADLTATDFPGIGEALKYAGATAHSAHQSLASATASLGSLSNHGLDGSIAGTGYRKVINAFAAPSSSPKSSQYAAMRQYHLKASDFLDKNHNLKSMPDLMDILNSHLKGQSGTQRLKFMHDFFGTTGQEAGNYLAENPNEIRKLTKQAQNATHQKNGKSYNENLAAKNMKSWQNQLNRTKAILSDMGMSFARSILPSLASGLKYINKILTAINGWPKGVKTTLATLLTITGVLTVMVATFKLLKTAGGFLLGFGGKGKDVKSAVNATEAVAGSKGSRTVFGDAFKGLKSAGRGGLEKVLNFNDSKGIFTALGKNKSLLGGGTKNIFAGAKGLFKSGGMRAVAGDATKGLLKTGAKGLLSATPFDAVMSATELIGMNKKNRGEKIGRAGGSFAGGATGAAIGTAILPGIGTVLGGIGGTMLGTKLGGKLGKGIQKALPAIRKTMSNLFKGNLGWEKAIGGAFTKAFKGVGKFFTGKLGWEQSLGKNVAGMVKSVQRALRPLGKVFSAVFGTVGKIIKGFVTGLKYAFVIPIATVVGLGIKAWQKFSGPVKKALQPVTKFVTASFKAIKSTIGGVWKWLSKTTSSVWSGFKKHVSTPVKDTFKTVDKWIVKKLVGSVKGAWSGLKKATRSAWRLIKRYVVNPVKSVWNAVNRYVIKLIVRKIGNAWDDIKKATRSTWRLIRKYVVNPIHDAYNSVTDFMSKLKKGMTDKMDDIKSAWSKAWNGIADVFQSIWEKIKNFTKDGINSVIGVINTGIGGIDTVVHAFGGSSKAITKIPKANFATGTGYMSGQRRAITRPTIATLNDGFDSPETGNREMVLHPNGISELIHGRNVKRILEPGAEVLNATETRLSGFDTGHFAKGTGLLSGVASTASKAVKGAVSFAGSAFKNISSKFKAIKKLISNPGGYLSGLLSKPIGNSDVMKQFASGFYKNVKGQAKEWWSTLWSMASNVLSAGGGGPVSHSPGSGWHVTSGFGNRGAVSGGFSSHDGVDFSGAKVVHALQDAIVTRVGGAPSNWGGSNGIGESVATKGGKLSLIYQELNGKSNSGATLLVHKGDHVKQGQAIAKLGPAGTHVHIGASTEGLWSHGGGSTRGWLDVTKLHGSYGNKSNSVKNKGPLQSLIKSETGGMMGWIKEHLAPLMDNDAGGSQGNPGGSGVQRWRSLVKKALAAVHLSTSGSMVNRVLRQINTESGGNPKAMGGTDGLSDGHAEGLMQVKPGTFAANKLSGHGNIWNGYDNILAGLNYAKHRYGSSLSYLGNGHGYAKGGDVPAGQLSVVGEKGWELIAPKQNSHVYDHKTSKKIVKNLAGGGTTVKVTGSPVYVTVEGDVDDKTIGKIQDAVNEANDSLVDKFLEKMGANDLGGIPI